MNCGIFIKRDYYAVIKKERSLHGWISQQWHSAQEARVYTCNIWSSKTGKTNAWQKSEQWVLGGKWGGYKRETSGALIIFSTLICMEPRVYFVKGSSDLCTLYIFTYTFYFNLKKWRKGEEENGRKWRRKARKRRLTISHGQWMVIEGLGARKPGSVLWNIFLAVQDSLGKYKYQKRTN